MDEFLSLMANEDSTPEVDDQMHTSNQSPRSSVGESRSNDDPPPYTRHSTTIATKKKKSLERKDISSTVATAGVDEKLGIRMINRNISSLDLTDLITTTSPYHSPAQLSAMSLQGLCSILVDPPSIVDKATVQGRTHLVTVGIVFHNSGTRTSSRGGAFCILTIGSNLQTGPCVSIFLFGTAYSKFSRPCQAGQVVAISNPKLLPARESGGGKNNDTSISLSVHDQSQIVHVAKARDYGICKALVRGKQSDGTWKNNAATCKTCVDTRVSEYCEFHRKQQGKKKQTDLLANCSKMRGVGGVSTKGSGANLIQNLRMARAQTQEARRNMVDNRFLGGAKRQPSSTVPPSSIAASHHPPRQSNMTNVRSSIISVHAPAVGKNTSNKFLSQKSKRPSVRPPAASTTTVAQNNRGNQLKKGNSINPYLNRSVMVPAAQKSSGKKSGFKDIVAKQNQHVPATGDWLQESIAKKISSTSSISRYVSKQNKARPRKINTVGCGFDGAVAVPKPSLLFAKQASDPSRSFASTATSSLHDEHEQEKIREQQALLAQRLRGANTRQGITNKFTDKGNGRKKTSTSNASGGNAFLDSVQVDDINEALKAKSQFASEADAEEYAKNRKRVVELEQLEFKQNKRSRITVEKENQKIQKEWVCYTCLNRPTFSHHPKQCINSGHRVAIKRDIKASATKEDERSKMNEKASDQGGLTLGSGLEWSKNRYKD